MATTSRPYRTALAALALAALTVNASGCGLIFSAGSTEVTLETDPPGAAVYIDGQPRGTTPLTVEVDNHEDHIITLHPPNNGAPAACHLTASAGAGWIVLDIVFGLLPVIVDALTDGWTTLDQDRCYARLSTGSADPGDTPVARARGDDEAP